jgi:hypothetical protein
LSAGNWARNRNGAATSTVAVAVLGDKTIWAGSPLASRGETCRAGRHHEAGKVRAISGEAELREKARRDESDGHRADSLGRRSEDESRNQEHAASEQEAASSRSSVVGRCHCAGQSYAIRAQSNDLMTDLPLASSDH